jgi:hypothetical protein
VRGVDLDPVSYPVPGGGHGEQHGHVPGMQLALPGVIGYRCCIGLVPI